MRLTGRFQWMVIAGVALLALVSAGCAGAPAAPGPATNAPLSPAAQVTQTGATMKISSAAFGEGEMIPKQYTCDGANVSPPLAWSGTPENAQALALIADDPDAPGGTWVHWVVFNLPPDAGGLPEGAPASAKTLANDAVQGTNSFRKIGYGGPCPPGGVHRYYFKLYALDGPLALTSNATAKDVQEAMRDHILAQAQLMGRYKR